MGPKPLFVSFCHIPGISGNILGVNTFMKSGEAKESCRDVSMLSFISRIFSGVVATPCQKMSEDVELVNWADKPRVSSGQGQVSGNQTRFSLLFDDQLDQLYCNYFWQPGSCVTVWSAGTAPQG